MQTYYRFKSIFKKKIYLTAIGNRDNRKSFTQGFSAHDLAIERGRYENIKPEKRICKNCQTRETEDEFQLLITCPKYFYYMTSLLFSG